MSEILPNAPCLINPCQYRLVLAGLEARVPTAPGDRGTISSRKPARKFPGSQHNNAQLENAIWGLQSSFRALDRAERSLNKGIARSRRRVLPQLLANELKASAVAPRPELLPEVDSEQWVAFMKAAPTVHEDLVFSLPRALAVAEPRFDGRELEAIMGVDRVEEMSCANSNEAPLVTSSSSTSLLSDKDDNDGDTGYMLDLIWNNEISQASCLQRWPSESKPPAMPARLHWDTQEMTERRPPPAEDSKAGQVSIGAHSTRRQSFSALDRRNSFGSTATPLAGAKSRADSARHSARHGTWHGMAAVKNRPSSSRLGSKISTIATEDCFSKSEEAQKVVALLAKSRPSSARQGSKLSRIATGDEDGLSIGATYASSNNAEIEQSALAPRFQVKVAANRPFSAPLISQDNPSARHATAAVTKGRPTTARESSSHLGRGNALVTRPSSPTRPTAFAGPRRPRSAFAPVPDSPSDAKVPVAPIKSANFEPQSRWMPPGGPLDSKLSLTQRRR